MVAEEPDSYSEDAGASPENFVLKPNTRKILFKNLLSLLGAVLLLLLMLIVFELTFGLALFAEILGIMGISLSPAMLLLLFLIPFVGVALFVFLGNLLAAENQRYEFTESWLAVSETVFFFYQEERGGAL